MSKLVDKERLAKLAKELDARAKAAVAAEKERAMAAEQAIDAKAVANAAAIAAINNTENGILAQAKAHAKGLVDGEISRAEEQEGLLAGRISTLEGIVGTTGEAGALGKVITNVAENTAAITKLNGGADVEGSVAKAVADAVDAEAKLREAADKALSDRVTAAENFVTAQPAKDKAQSDRIAVIEEMMGLGGATGNKTAIEELQDSIDAVEGKADKAQAEVDAVEQRLDAEGGLVDRIKAVETFKDVTYPAAEAKLKSDLQKEIDDDVAVETNRATAKENELDAAIKAEAARADAAEKANKAVIDKLDGAVNVEGSVKKQIKDAVDAVNADAEALKVRVKANEDKLTGLEKATVKAEIEAAQAAAEKHADDAITALVDSAPDAMNTLNELAKAIKDNEDVYKGYVEEHATAMASMKSDLQKEIDKDVKVVADALADEKNAAKDGSLAKKIADEVARAKAEEADIRSDFATADQALANADTALSNRIKVFEAGGAQDVAAKEVRLAAAETFIQEHSHEELQGEIDAVEGRVGALETFKTSHSHTAMEKGIADNKAAIEKEVEDRDAAIATALAPYSTTAEMKAILGNVVNSLALTMENNQVVLKLGGVDGIEVTSVQLEMVTDEEIDAIIDGLDAK